MHCNQNLKRSSAMHVMLITQSSNDMHASHVMYSQMNNANSYAKVQYEWLNNVSTSLPACRMQLVEVRYVKTALGMGKVRTQCVITNRPGTTLRTYRMKNGCLKHVSERKKIWIFTRYSTKFRESAKVCSASSPPYGIGTGVEAWGWSPSLIYYWS
jgi:hypothetical protein